MNFSIIDKPSYYDIVSEDGIIWCRVPKRQVGNDGLSDRARSVIIEASLEEHFTKKKQQHDPA